MTVEVSRVFSPATGQLIAVHVACPVHGVFIYTPEAVAAIEANKEDHADCQVTVTRAARRRAIPAKSRRSAVR